MKRDAEKINDELFYNLLVRNASPHLYEMGEAKLMCGIIAGALADADWVAGPMPKSVEGQRRWRQKHRERNEARTYLTEGGGMMEYHAGLVGLDPQFVREQVAVIRKWAQEKDHDSSSGLDTVHLQAAGEAEGRVPEALEAV